MPDHHERRRRPPVQAGGNFLQRVGLRAHLHVQHGDSGDDLGPAEGHASARDLDLERVWLGGAIRHDSQLEAVAVLVHDLRHASRADTSARAALLRECLRGRSEAREDRGCDHRRRQRCIPNEIPAIHFYLALLVNRNPARYPAPARNASARRRKSRQRRFARLREQYPA